ncbi:aminopeptidase P family protein [Phyllobacterium phragmitis]|uniref:Aminopeptidase P family protein n=1 Tax=Phyllobacterium phragmitis TaxID=2670329 RepID=A0A2S9IT34_9HYPH|nr:Xaa-Pro peptidase family protein [Phyllobacterium phragmitis]PRD43685.1 aminopeptidase P family protein [Phyllobacterium phragmitis]
MIQLGSLDRKRAHALLEEARLDGMVLIQPESVTYATGAKPGSAAGWRRAGAVFVIVPANANVPMTAIVGDFYAEEFRAASGIEDIVTFPVWVDLIDIAPYENGTLVERLSLARPAKSARARPANYDADLTFGLLADVLRRRGLASARLGTEYAFLPFADAGRFSSACPDVRWSDASQLVSRLRMIKSQQEIALLRIAAQSAEAGVAAAISNLEPGRTGEQLFSSFHAASSRRAVELGYDGPIYPVGTVTVGPKATGWGRPAQKGDIIRLDVGCTVQGYTSDSARTAVMGQPSEDQRAVYNSLHKAFHRGLGLLRPGIPLRAVHAAAMRSMHDDGFTMYCRGHFGHGVGASVFVEEWPFISADEHMEIEAGMVLAYELPWYIRGLGAFMLEDQFIIAAETAEPCWSLSRNLVVCEC